MKELVYSVSMEERVRQHCTNRERKEAGRGERVGEGSQRESVHHGVHNCWEQSPSLLLGVVRITVKAREKGEFRGRGRGE